MTRETSAQMDWLSPDGEVEQSRDAADGISPRLVFALDNRDWLRFLVDEWWPSHADAKGVSLGVGRACGDPGGMRMVVMVWLDPGQLPSLQAAIYGDGRWRDGLVDSIVLGDSEVRWPGPIPLSAVSAFSVSSEKERARLLAMAKGFSNVEIPPLPIEVKPTAFNPTASHEPTFERLCTPPVQWNAIRGAAAMALWAVPTIDPWLDLFCEALSNGSRESVATALGAPWLDAPPWICSTNNDRLMPLWAAIREVLGAVNYRQEWRPTEVLDAIVDSAAQLGADAKALLDLQLHTRAVLADAAVIDVRRAERDPLGLALQLVLLRPMADQFVSWTDDLPAMPPAVWWTGAMLAGLLTGMRDLDAQFRGSASSRNLLAVRTWHLSAEVDAADSVVWPDASAVKPSWVLKGGRVHFLDSGRLWADRKPSRRGHWFRANYQDEPTYRQAIDVARRLHPSCLRRCLRISDADLTVSGSGKLSLDKTGHGIKVRGSVSIALDDKVSLEDELDVDQFRDWLAVGSIAERLPTVPDSGMSGLQAPPSCSSDPITEARGGDHVKQRVRLPDDPPGLSTTADFISSDEEQALIAEIEGGDWLDDLARKVQHYGWKYDYRARSVDPGAYLGPLPQWAADLAQRLVRHGLVRELPDQVIVNEYIGSQGIAKHVDCPACFRGAIVTISLCESWGMVFRNGEHKVERVLQRRSAVVLDGEVRDKWTHEIPKRKKEGTAVRVRRISITFRKVIPYAAKPKRTGRRNSGVS